VELSAEQEEVIRDRRRAVMKVPGSNTKYEFEVTYYRANAISGGLCELVVVVLR
jgi:hypothetical protein